VSGEIAHPLIVPLPRLAAPAARVVRQLALARLRAAWRVGRIDLELPSGELAALRGDHTASPRGEETVAPGTGERAPCDSSVPSARVRVHDDRLFARLLLRGELGVGESFVAGEWSSDDLVAVTRAFLRATRARGLESPLTRLGRLPALLRHRRAANTRAGSERNVHAHYDLGNAFYRLFLDEDTLSYSCALWTDDSLSLAEAQRRKLDRLCDWLALSPRDHLLEIGCGWGGMAIHAARTRGCRVTAITISREQHELASARVAAAGLADRVTIEYRDYRDLGGTFDETSGFETRRGFDKIVSVEMLEQVGLERLPQFFATCARVLAPGGRLALQTITMPDERFASYRSGVDWMQTYIFPGTLIPSLGVIRAACAPFALRETDDIGPSYAPTLRAWRERFLAALPEVRALGFDAPFIRTWLLYLAFSEAAFAERTLGDHQLLFVR
jgi:cyclopropane-fatty-acyl-phospholipid synthase